MAVDATKGPGELPPELQELDLTPKQLEGVAHYLAVREYVATRERNTILMMCAIIGANVMIRSMNDGADAADLPFKSLIEAIHPWIISIFLVLGTVSVAFYRWRVYQWETIAFPRLEIPAEKIKRLRSIGGMIVPYVWFRWTMWFRRRSKKMSLHWPR